ncbi:MAG TPA: hypothetical protein V6C89_13935 [Drouetiella sp.]|jgi:Protein kinase domain
MSEEVLDLSADTRKFIHYPFYTTHAEQPHRLYPIVDIGIQIFHLGLIIVLVEFMMVVTVPAKGPAEASIYIALLIPFVVAFFRILSRSARLSVSSSGISFPFLMAPNLNGKLFRPWSDIQSVDLHEAKDNLNYVRGNVLTMTFGSGGTVDIDTTRIPRDDLRILQDCLVKYTHLGNSVPALAELVSRNDVEIGDSQMFVFAKKHRNLLSDSFGLSNHSLLARGDVVLDGDYIVQEIVASSGARSSYLADDVSASRLVCLTEYDLLLVDAEVRAQAAGELLQLGERYKNLQVPGLLDLHDIRVTGDKFYTVTEPKPESLRSFVQSEGSLSENRVCSLALKLAETVEQLQCRHADLSHGGIKPDSIIYKKTGVVLVSEFGFVDDILMKHSNLVLVDAAYAAPERIAGCSQAESDLYSIGAVMYFALTGQDPIAYASSEVRARQTNVSIETSRLVERLLSVDPANRGTVRDLIHDLGGFVADQSSGTTDLEAKIGRG